MGTDTMFKYILEEGDPIWTLMVSYFMQKDMDNNGTTSNDGGRIGDACDLDRSALLSAHRLVRRPYRGEASFLRGC